MCRSPRAAPHAALQRLIDTLQTGMSETVSVAGHLFVVDADSQARRVRQRRGAVDYVDGSVNHVVLKER